MTFSGCKGFLFVVAGSVAMTLASGCGVGAPGLPEASTAVMRATNGTVHGGPNPVTNATVTLYETQVSATSTYGTTPPKVLATATTGNFGQFRFTAGYTCDTAPYMQYVYLAVTGGNTGAGVNNNAVLMAALGPCSNFTTATAQNATQVFVSEATTVASAYALANFMTVGGAAGAQVVTVSSSAANDSTTPACTGTGAAMTCTANGLGHAFTTAASLASQVSLNNGATPTGLFNATVASYPGSVIPQVMLNTVADAMQGCVNTTGGAVNAGASDGTTCGNFFLATTPTGGATPTDTLGAAINIARFPSNAATVGTGGIYAQVPPNGYFQPALAAPPSDYSLGIFYPGTSGGTVYSPNSFSLALDAADNIYVLAADNNTISTFGTTPTTGNITTTGLAGYIQAATGLAPLYPYTTASSNTLTVPGNVAVDSVGNVFASNPTNVANTNEIRRFTAANGALTATYVPTFGSGTTVNFVASLGFDRSNQLWSATQNPVITSGSTLYRAGIYQFPTNGAAVNGITGSNSTNYSAVTNAQQGTLSGIAFDANQNVFSCSNGSAAGTATNTIAKVYGFPNAGGVAGTTLYQGAPPTAGASGQLGGNPTGNLGVDAAGNVFCPNRKQILLAVPAAAGVISANPIATQQSYVTSVPQIADLSTGSQIDGNNNYVTTGRSANGRLYLVPIVNAVANSTTFGGVPVVFDPCYPAVSAAVGGTYCSSNTTGFPANGTQPSFAMINNSTQFQVDSAGSVWIAVGATSATTGALSGLVQVIGPAAPVWPQLSYNKPGVKP